MDTLVILQGPQPGRRFTLAPEATVIGRQSDSTICLDSLAVSRHHARIVPEDGGYFVEDLGSSNGTYLNGQRLLARAPMMENDRLQLGPYLFTFRRGADGTDAATGDDTEHIIREQVSVLTTNQGLYDRNPSQKLQVVLEIAQHLARTLEVPALLGKLLDQLLHLFPQADRGVALLGTADRLQIGAQRSRTGHESTNALFSKTIVTRALEEGIGLLSEDVQMDERFIGSNTISNLHTRSLLCVPLVGQNGRRLGVIQLERSRPGTVFRVEDLQLLSTLCLQVAVVLENASLHAELLREERFRQELALAREIQQGFLPAEFPAPEESGFELYACVHPARQVSGDLYDFLPLSDGRLAFFVGDVSGKGMPAALFMVAVRTLCRHLAAVGESPAATLAKLNTALAADNPSAMFVTLAHGIYDPKTGAIVMASGGHPLPMLRQPNGDVETLPVPSGRLLGAVGGNLRLSDYRFTLEPGETLILFTDGYIEAVEPVGKEMFELDRLQAAVGGPRTFQPLAECAEQTRLALDRFIGHGEQQDDLTLFLLRRLATRE